MVARTIALPNIKQMFIPDPGFMICDVDLAQADAQVVAWESEDESLKQLFNEIRTFQPGYGKVKPDLHNQNTADIFGSCSGSGDKNRPKAKAGVHATNYGATPPTLARTLGITVKDAEHFQSQWFGAHPGILKWHDRIEYELATKRCVRNAFGYVRYYFDRPDKLLSEALAWVPQSTVALIISKAMLNIHNWPEARDLLIQLLIQVHDSHVTQFPIPNKDAALDCIRRATEIVVPYPDPLIIPCGASISKVSYGDCKEVEWPTIT